MRLINVKTSSLEEFHEDQVPAYAILSHTWGVEAEELTFQDVEEGNVQKSGIGSTKFRFCCQQAEEDGYTHVWIDTCCINKADMVELSEAINSMFRWYERAAVCYVYLSDVAGNQNPREEGSSFQSSRWFRRGWTLQELLAPTELVFYSSEWRVLGTKVQLCTTLERITGIPVSIVRGVGAIRCASIAQRMSWAARRKTKRKEDQAYCLLGVFGISMPMIYGEGSEKAFFRLQEHIIKNLRDQSILAWGLTQDGCTEGRGGKGPKGLLAATPADFAHSGTIVPRDRTTSYLDSIEISGGSLRLSLSQVASSEGLVGLLNCGPEADIQTVVGIRLFKTSPGGPEEYTRRGGCHFMKQTNLHSFSVRTALSVISNDSGPNTKGETHAHWLYDEDDLKNAQLKLIEVTPPSAWDSRRAVITSEVLSRKDARPSIVMKLRPQGPEGQDFILMLHFNTKDGDIGARYCLATCARDTSTKEIWVNSPLIYKHVSSNTTACNGAVTVKVTTELMGGAATFLMRLAKVKFPPFKTIDLTWEMRKPQMTLKIEGILHDQQKWHALSQLEYDESGEITSIQSTPVFLWAFKYGYHEIVEILRVTQRIDMNEVRSPAGLSLLTWAIELDHASIVEILLQGGADVEANNCGSLTPLSLAVKLGNVKIVQSLLTHGADMAAVDYLGLTPLCLAAVTGNTEIVNILLDKGSDMRFDSLKFGTPLHAAVRHGQEAIVTLLIGRGADANATASYLDSVTPLHIAALCGHKQIATLLLKAGAQADAARDNLSTSLHLAAYGGHVDIIRLLLDAGATLDARDNESATPLHYAARVGHEAVIALLLARGADRDLRDNDGNKPSRLALKYGITILDAPGRQKLWTRASAESALHRANG
ncbi:Vegetative incompatibility protein [Paramyrothecium foliicola]|nr:Vegetative incompatibility protein [Paramyrothecium foliicola]